MKDIKLNGRYTTDVVALQTHLINNGFDVLSITSNERPPFIVLHVADSENKNPNPIVGQFNEPVNQKKNMIDQIKQKRQNNEALTNEEILAVIDFILGVN